MSPIHIKPLRLLLAFLTVGSIALTIPNPPNLPLQDTLGDMFALWEANES
ncbi:MULTISPECIES: hypothetical protein [unclassified Leptolyngbya]|nr:MULTISPECIES: hypothetical protein [unclassified Leptolyngbya]MBD1910255.1 hypothetical protein [Leptolyngbya sp. FACHB-8]MBD2156422.1 hypothetical protein [Leptolyngbya sp. FACHB-16]